MVYTCQKCGKPTMRAYSTSDGFEKCLCSFCVAEYEKELKNQNDSDAVKNAEDRINKKIQNVIKNIASIRDRLQEHENKNGNLEKRIETLEKTVAQLQNEIDALSTERVKQIKSALKGAK